ncbi:MAG: dTMP kinase [Verrucomicrobiota bacterium]
MRGKLITFEGSEGCGKSTQVRMIADWLMSQNIPLICPRDPGATPLGEAIRNLLKFHSAGRGMSEKSELLLFAASRAELCKKVIEPALDAGKWIICDRFYDSTTAYQGNARGLDMRAVNVINSFAVGSCVPNLTIILDLEAAEARTRIAKRRTPKDKKDRMESEPDAFYEKVREGYRQIAQKELKRVRLISASGDPGPVFESIKREILLAFPEIFNIPKSERPTLAKKTKKKNR